MSDFTLGVVNVWGGECLGGERLTIFDNWNTSWAHIGAHQDFRFLKKKFGPILELIKFQYL